MNEQWRDVPGFEGKYQVSSHGNLKRLAYLRPLRAGHVAKMPERIWPGYIDSQGYFSVSVGKLKTTVHRLVCVAFHGDAPDGQPNVAHWDGNKLNNRADNLRWASHAENSRDGKRLGETFKGEKAWKARLTREDVASIRREYAALGGARGAMSQIAARRGLGRNHVRQIVRRELWKTVE